jgi:membrane-bound ClpP family serine protease
MFVVAVFRAKGHWAFLIISIAAIMAGSVFLFSGETWWKPSVNPILAAVVSISSGAFFYFAARKVMEARATVPTHDLNSIIGEVGEAKTAIQAEGSVQVAGSLERRTVTAYPPVHWCVWLTGKVSFSKSKLLNLILDFSELLTA